MDASVEEVQEEKPKPVLPDGWPMRPVPFSEGWIALPIPFGQIHESDLLVEGCGTCGETMFVMALVMKRVKGQPWRQETVVQCPNCLKMPTDAMIVGDFDLANRRMKLRKDLGSGKSSSPVKEKRRERY